MTLDERPTLLAVQHVPWEGPHRILDACGALEVKTVKPLAGQPLPAHEEVAGAVFMGGPMNVDEVERFPALAAEREWLVGAVERGMPVLGICLGAQLLARALGAEVKLGKAAEIGFAPVRSATLTILCSAVWRHAARSSTGTATSSTCPTVPNSSPPLGAPPARPSAPATPGASFSIPRRTSLWSRHGWRCRR
jgi:Glutamine amidotransferase class-I